MDKKDKKEILLELLKRSGQDVCDKYLMQDSYFYQALTDMYDLKQNYGEYLTTSPIDCDRELERIPVADYELCAALLTMLLREDHFNNGAFGRRLRSGDVRSIIERMIATLE